MDLGAWANEEYRVAGTDGTASEDHSADERR
jgi:endogenous inhibitor of DNA gyrase (YacG/DUF329 family)